jgi:hypothetical protein
MFQFYSFTIHKVPQLALDLGQNVTDHKRYFGIFFFFPEDELNRSFSKEKKSKSVWDFKDKTKTQCISIL